MELLKRYKFEIACFLGLVAIGFVIYLNIENKRISSNYDSLIQEQKEKLVEERKQHENAIIYYESESDKYLAKSDSLEKVIKSNKIRYSNEIKKLSNINTYNARQRYADSLARAMRFEH